MQSLSTEKDKFPTLEECLSAEGEKGFEALFNTYYAQLCLYSQKYVGSAADAEQCVMDVFTKLWECQSTIQIKTDVRYYLFASIRNRSLDLLRRSKVMKVSAETASAEISVDHFTPFDQIYWKHALHDVERVIETLPKKCRRIFKMSRYDGKKYTEIAEELNLSVKTIETQISKALKVLRQSPAAQNIDFLAS